MVRLREIPRTAAFTWSPGASAPFLATGTRAGAVDADFSNDTRLELWNLNLADNKESAEIDPTATIDTDSRFHDIAWIQSKKGHGRGVIAGALENGSLDLWDADKILSRQSNPLMSRTSKHSGAIKTIQFNPFRSELLATAGAKGELYISDLNNVENPFRLGNTAGRADDFECLDWNKKVAHIMVTGSNGGFVTVWDVKTKKESLTLNNLGRKPVSAVAWDPEKPTRLITAVPLDSDPLILVWDLRNSNTPEKVLRGHDGGVLSLSWCQQDSDLLLSCGKDNRTLCWNPQSGELYGEFPVVTNWTFQTRWNPHNPGILATASFDGKIAIQTIQNTKASASLSHPSAPLDGEAFFDKASSQPQPSSFTLPKAPKWLQRPSAVSFGFGGKIVSLNRSSTASDTPQSIIKISSFAADDEISSLVEGFTKTMEEKDLARVCTTHIDGASNEAEKNDWRVIKTLISDNPRKELVISLGFDDYEAQSSEGAQRNGNKSNDRDDSIAKENVGQNKQTNRLSSFFDTSEEGDNFLANLASTKGAKTNNPFHMYDDSESPADKSITLALMLGQFDNAMEICLAEDRLSDAFMIAVCGGQASIEKVQQAYFKKQAAGPKYLRLLASVVGKDLWDIVYNADLENWKEVMATLCTYASADEFSDLCETLGDRLEEASQNEPGSTQHKQSSSFCYIASSNLEKVVGLWIADLESSQSTQLEKSDRATSFSIHLKALQSFIEKVTVFREATGYHDSDRKTTGDWKLAALYEKYSEYADTVAVQGHLEAASRYLELLPDNYPAADVARNRVHQATKKALPQETLRQNVNPNMLQPRVGPSTTGLAAPALPAQPSLPSNPYAPTQTYYGSAESNQHANSSFQSPGQHQQGGIRPMVPHPPPIKGPPQSSSGISNPPQKQPPPRAANMPNWNDTPEDFFKPPTSRRGTPGVHPPPVSTPIANSAVSMQSGTNLPYGTSAFRSAQPAPPPPKGPAPPPRNMTSVSHQLPDRPSSAAANAYGPPSSYQAVPAQPTPSHMPRVQSPYNAPPTSGPLPTSSRYAPNTTSTMQQTAHPIGAQRAAPPPNPYASRPDPSSAQTIPQVSTGPPLASTQPHLSAPQQQMFDKSHAPKYATGDRSHIPPHSVPIFEMLNEDMQRVKAKAPASFKPQVMDTEKRLNILFDHLNNETLLKSNTIQDMVELSNAIRTKNYERAQDIHLDVNTNRTDECGNWMTGVKRLIGMSKATP